MLRVEKTALTLLAMAGLFVTGLAHAQAPAQQPETDDQKKSEVMHVEEIRNKAMLDHDVATLDRMYAEDLSWSNPSGESLTKAQVLADLVSGKQKFYTVTHDQIRLHVWGNTVIADGRSTSTLEYKGKLSKGIQRRFLNVYVKRDGAWLLVAHSQTVIADQNPDIDEK
jgi:ketosteroid isomerase-like protein